MHTRKQEGIFGICKTEDITIASDADILSISKTLIKQNKEAYEALPEDADIEESRAERLHKYQLG